MCPLSNVKLRVFTRIERPQPRSACSTGACASPSTPTIRPTSAATSARTIVAAARALGLGRDDIVRLARNSFRASFLSPAEKQAWLDKVDRYAASHSA